MTAINSITQADIEAFSQSHNINDYQTFSSFSAIYPGKGTPLGISYCAHKLAGEAGEFNEHFGKAQRDDNLMEYQPWQALNDEKPHGQLTFNDLTPQRREALIKELGDVLWYVAALARELEVSLSDVALMNLTKLSSRSQRGTLQGSGDER